jgi:hypothetical protein
MEQELFNKPNNRVVLIIGHPRSGTTNVQKAFHALGRVGSVYYLDLIMSSLLMKYASAPAMSALDYFFLKRIASSEHTPNHKIGLDEELEENVLMMHYFKGGGYYNTLFKHLEKFIQPLQL